MNDMTLVGPFPATIPPVHTGLYRVQIETPESADGLTPAAVEVRQAHWDGLEFVEWIGDDRHTIKNVIQWWGQPIPPKGRLQEAVNTLIRPPLNDGLDDDLEDMRAHIAHVTGQDEDGL